MSAVYDSPRQRMLIFGGGANYPIGNELWSLTLTGAPTWSLLAPSGLPPWERQLAGAVYDPVRDRMLVYGGFNGVYYMNDVWAYSPGSTVSVPAPSLESNAGLALAPPRPNPSSGEAVLDYLLPQPGRVTLEVFDTSGRRVQRILDSELSAGHHVATWRGEGDGGKPVHSGIYFVRLQCDGQTATRRVLRLD